MPATLANRHILDLSQVGASVILSVAGVAEISVRALDHETWGSGVVTVRKVSGGDSFPFSVAVTVSNAAPTAEGVDVSDVLEIELAVTTAGTGYGRVGIAGKETR